MARKGKLNREQVLNIPKLLNSMSMGQIARHYGVSNQAIYYWVKILKSRGYKIKTRKRGSVGLI